MIHYQIYIFLVLLNAKTNEVSDKSFDLMLRTHLYMLNKHIHKVKGWLDGRLEDGLVCLEETRVT